MKRCFTSVFLLLLVVSPVQAVILSPDIVFTVRDDSPADGNPDRSSVGLGGGFTGFITNDHFVDETFIEFAVGSESVLSATLNFEVLLYDDVGIHKTFDISSYSNGNGNAQLNLFATGNYLATAPVDEFFTLNFISLDVSALYNNAVSANDDFLGIRLHNAVPLDGGSPQVIYNDSSLRLSEIPLPASIWLLGTALLGLVGFTKRRNAGQTQN